MWTIDGLTVVFPVAYLILTLIDRFPTVLKIARGGSRTWVTRPPLRAEYAVRDPPLTRENRCPLGPSFPRAVEIQYAQVECLIACHPIINNFTNILAVNIDIK